MNNQQKQNVLVHALFGSSNSVSSKSSLDQSDGEDDEEVSSCSNTGPLYELSQLMEDLPIKRGISKFYNGKSQSFASLVDAEIINNSSGEGLEKKGRCYNRRMKWSKGFVGIHHHHHHHRKFIGPKSGITKRLSPGRSYSQSSDGTMGSAFSSNLLVFHA